MSVTQSDIPEIFFEDGWITAVDSLISSGKEGTVFCCLADPHTGYERLAVKIHRGRSNRSFKNDSIYLTGRAMGVSLNGSSGVKGSGMRDRRLERAVAKRSKAGVAAIDHSWINHEFNTMQVLHEAGAMVPRPLAMHGQAMLMEYLGDADGPAPKLKQTRFSPHEARELHATLLDQIELWLANDRIHGDLSPFNILMWRGRPVVIDFPQAVNPWENPNSLMLLERDIRNVSEFFEAFGVRANASRLAEEMWFRFMRGELAM